MAPLFIGEDEVKQLLTMSMALDAVEQAHRLHGVGQAIDLPRSRTRLPQTMLHILQGAIPSLGVIGYKAYTTSREGMRFFVHLFDAASGAPLAVIAADYLGMVRTGAAGGVAAKRLAVADAGQAGVFGAGWQATSQIEALCAVRPLKRIKVYARNAEKLAAFCERMQERVGIPVTPAAEPRDAVVGSAIVTTITTSATPVFDGNWLEPGTHINAAGANSLVRREIDETAVRRADLICVDSRAVALKESGDLLPALEKGRLHEGQLHELGEIVAGVRPGRSDPRQITLFESHGMAIQDLALAARLLPLARERGMGRVLQFDAGTAV